MLFVLAVLLLMIWLAALVLKVTAWFIHLVLLAAVVLFIVSFVHAGRPSRTVS